MTFNKAMHFGVSWGATAATAWDPANTNVNLTRSNSDLTLTQTGTSWSGSRALTSASTGLRIFQVHIDVMVDAIMLGVGTFEANLSNYLGSGDFHSIGIRPSDGQAFYGNSLIGTGSTYAAGDTVTIVAKKLSSPYGARVWFRTNSGNWNNDAGADPATDAGGFDGTNADIGLFGDPMFPMVAINTEIGDALTANFGASAFSPAAPSGGIAWPAS